MINSIFLALCSNISFSVASLYFTDFSKKISSVWVNYVKALVAFVCFSLLCLFLSIPFQLSQLSFFWLCISGFLGLFIGDIFLFKGFAHLGSGRVLMIFGFQPLFLGIASVFIFQESFSLNRLIAIFFLILCLLCFSLESVRQKGHWDFKGIMFALIGILLDGSGVLLTKKAFIESPEMSVFSANLIRMGSALLGFFILSFLPQFKMSLIEPFTRLETKEKKTILFASFLGTFLSLTFYLKAIQIGHIATISAITGTSPLFATIFEIYKGRKPLTKYLVIALFSFVIGVSLLIFL